MPDPADVLRLTNLCVATSEQIEINRRRECEDCEVIRAQAYIEARQRASFQAARDELDAQVREIMAFINARQRDEDRAAGENEETPEDERPGMRWKRSSS